MSVETGFADLSDNFYDETSRIDFAAVVDYESMLQVGNDVVDCRTVTTGSAEDYVACGNVLLESWYYDTDFYPDFLERPTNFGVLGEDHWYVPRFTIERDPSLASFIGLAGEVNRRKLAETFKRPTTWKTYCDEVSTDGCASDDGVAVRMPTEDEQESFFAPGLYIGHFRATEENDCDQFPDTCTGHFADFPCTWNSHMKQQAYHLGISLQSGGSDGNGGYSYGELVQIWQAANATKSDVMMTWWTPETMYEQFVGSEAEFTQVLLPPVTDECVVARADPVYTCSDNETLKFGDPAGVCDWPILNLKKVVTATLGASSEFPSDRKALWSPAYEAILDLEMTSLQYSNIFQAWFNIGVDGWGFDLREATCHWVVDNIDKLQAVVPASYPRHVVESETKGSGWFVSAYVLSGLALLLVITCMAATFIRRQSKAVYYVQVRFLALLLIGLMLAAIGSLLLITPQSQAVCIVSPSFQALGVTLVLATLFTRSVAIAKLAASGKRTQRVVIRSKTLIHFVLPVVLVVAIMLVVWGVVDTPEKITEYDLTSRSNAMGETIVIAYDWCSSQGSQWGMALVLWQAVFVVPSLVLVLNVRQWTNDNDTKALRRALAARLVMLIVRTIGILGMIDSLSHEFMAFISVTSSLDTIGTIIFYIMPKFFLSDDDVSKELLPEVFLHTTVMVASIDGFTAWSSVREPIQVFKLLEVVFESFDSVADRYMIFKSETSASYLVAAAGIPESRPDHALAMARFASDIMKKLSIMTKQLESQFGPDTADLGLRIGLDSGPITGGYTYGSAGSFQMFGDTMTMARLLHESGEHNEIHISEATAELLIKSGKKHWVSKKEKKLMTTEKGEVQTFVLSRHSALNGSGHEMGSRQSDDDFDEDDDEADFDNQHRWIEWNTETLRKILVKIVARSHGGLTRPSLGRVSLFQKSHDVTLKNQKIPLEEVQEIIELPDFDKTAMRRVRDMDEDDALPEEVVSQLHDFVTQVASMYRQNPFHNFAHASYVVMAVTKYLNRINAATELDVGFDADRQHSSTHAAMHGHTYGITSDPLTHFACVFSALIHDVDHPGVPNPQLIQENERLATIYKNRSVAEQRSFDMSWDLFMDSSFNLLRNALCPTEAELLRFRRLVINCVMATDLGDKELKELRNNRWSAAFDEGAKDVNTKRGVNRKATIVIEHLIQAADVAHMCQHWYIYRKWNERLFRETYEAYRAGRAAKNPAEFWYQGELGFFDFYIIPLSKKLRDCGVFGSTSDENLNYAVRNRAMWEKDGQAIVAQMLERAIQASSKVEASVGVGTSTTQSASETPNGEEVV
eukprot:Nitzschia sp. Nitz4//scaffold277_size25017//9057//13286//NITZ4_008346-RA/size25017-snap-gene-0.31-mRNA-1//1//CDS//3329545341//4362//frame0